MLIKICELKTSLKQLWSFPSTAFYRSTDVPTSCSTAKQYLGHWQGLPETNPGVASLASHLPLQCLEKLSARELLIASEVTFFLGIVHEVALALTGKFNAGPQTSRRSSSVQTKPLVTNLNIKPLRIYNGNV